MTAPQEHPATDQPEDPHEVPPALDEDNDGDLEEPEPPDDDGSSEEQEVEVET